MRNFDMRVSMSRKGECWDNAPLESFWGSLKSELNDHGRFTAREQARRQVTEYIEVYYNRMRKQARLGFRFDRTHRISHRFDRARKHRRGRPRPPVPSRFRRQALLVGRFAAR